jgi:hypothetical protein
LSIYANSDDHYLTEIPQQEKFKHNPVQLTSATVSACGVEQQIVIETPNPGSVGSIDKFTLENQRVSLSMADK